MVRPQDSCANPLNQSPDAASVHAVRHDVVVADCTLREGEQAGDAAFSNEDKVRLAERLSEIGVRHIQVGFVGKSAADREIVHRLKASGIKAHLEAMVLIFEPNWRDQVMMAADSGVDIISLLYPASDLALRLTEKVSREQALDITARAVRHAVETGALVRFAPTDSARADMEFLLKLYSTVVQAGAARVSISDTAGTLLPATMASLVRQVRSVVDVPIQVHCHNDFGLAVAGELAAIEAGASIVDCTVNGLGERAGNAPLDELVAALEFLYELDTGVDTTRLTELSRAVERMTGVAVPKSKPIVGEFAFAHKLDAHVRAAIAHPRLAEAIEPDWVGNARRVVLGKGSGPLAVGHRLSELGVEASEQQVARLVEAVGRSATAKRAALTDAEFGSLVREVLGMPSSGG